MVTITLYKYVRPTGHFELYSGGGTMSEAQALTTAIEWLMETNINHVVCETTEGKMLVVDDDLTKWICEKTGCVHRAA